MKRSFTGKIAMLVSMVVISACLGCGGYASTGMSDALTMKAEAKAKSVGYKKLYVEMLEKNKNKNKFDLNVLVNINNDDIPELIAFESYEYALSKYPGNTPPPSSIMNSLGGIPHVFTIVDKKVKEAKGWGTHTCSTYDQDLASVKVYNRNKGNYFAIVTKDHYGNKSFYSYSL